jgi:hypothetical protein
MNNRIKTKKFTSTVFALALGLGVAFGINYVSGNFTPPSQGFPNCPTTDGGCNQPINIGTTNQVKNGGLSVNGFLASAGAEFAQGVQFDQLANAPYAGDRSTCVNNVGAIKVCGTNLYSNTGTNTDFGTFDLVWDGSNWNIGNPSNDIRGSDNITFTGNANHTNLAAASNPLSTGGSNNVSNTTFIVVLRSSDGSPAPDLGSIMGATVIHTPFTYALGVNLSDPNLTGGIGFAISGTPGGAKPVAGTVIRFIYNTAYNDGR